MASGTAEAEPTLKVALALDKVWKPYCPRWWPPAPHSAPEDHPTCPLEAHWLIPGKAETVGTWNWLVTDAWAVLIVKCFQGHPGPQPQPLIEPRSP